MTFSDQFAIIGYKPLTKGKNMKKYQFTEEEKKELEAAKGGDKKAFEALSMKYRRRARKEGRYLQFTRNRV